MNLVSEPVSPAGTSRSGAFGAYGTVLIVPLDDLPDWPPACRACWATPTARRRTCGGTALAPIESSSAFLLAYQHTRGRMFTAVEQQIAWAASLWTAAYNAREEALHGDSPACREAACALAAERLRRAKA